MKLSEKQLETHLLKLYTFLDKTKESCKVMVSQCLQTSQSQNTSRAVLACLEASDAIDLCKSFMMNRSPNIKSCLSFTTKVLKTTMDELRGVGKEPYCAKLADFTIKRLQETREQLQKLHDEI